MKKHKDLLEILRSHNMRITPNRRILLQYILDNKHRQLSLNDIQLHLKENGATEDRSSVYRNVETLKKLNIIQELNLPKVGKKFQYVLDRKVHHFYICKSCGRSNRGNETLFKKIETALQEIHGFSKANLSVVFYGLCQKCSKSTLD